LASNGERRVRTRARPAPQRDQQQLEVELVQRERGAEAAQAQRGSLRLGAIGVRLGPRAELVGGPPVGRLRGRRQQAVQVILGEVEAAKRISRAGVTPPSVRHLHPHGGLHGRQPAGHVRQAGVEGRGCLGRLEIAFVHRKVSPEVAAACSRLVQSHCGRSLRSRDTRTQSAA
jgi:hypothetical protein